MKKTLALFLWAPVLWAQVIDVDSQRQLFLDDYLIASLEGVDRQIHPAEKDPMNPMVVPEHPWEAIYTLLYGSVIEDAGRYRMWYLTHSTVCYAESADGRQWTKPSLELFPHDGQATNVVVDRGRQEGVDPSLPYFYEIFGVFKDPRETNPAWRYKMGYLSIQRPYEGPRLDPFHGGQRRGLGVAGSPNGLQWESIDPWATEAICDGATHWTYDAENNKYILFGRTKNKSETLSKAWADDPHTQKNWWGRAVARTESPDFLHWEHSDPASAPIVMEAKATDPPATEVYGMGVFPYEGVTIGLVQRFHNRPEETLLDLHLAVSRDGGKHFERVGDGTPFLPCGPVGTWDRYNNALSNNPPILVGDDLRFYYSGRTYRHSPYKGPDKGVIWGAIGMASVKRDRFVSLSASFAGGTILTKVLRLTGKQLHINAQAAFGTIHIEFVGDDGEVKWQATPISADGLDLPVPIAEGAWTDQPGQLRIRLENALLYALWSE
jgi:hypothetical protein